MSKVFDSIYGLIVGDALGVPVEFEERDSYHVTDMVGGGSYEQPAGTWSDDSSMVLATMVSIVRKKSLDWEDIMQRFHKWFTEGEYTPHGECFDIGLSTELALEKYGENCPALDCGSTDEMSNGNGSLMRILPLAFYPHAQGDIAKLSQLTHAHAYSIRGCEIYIQLAQELLKGKSLRGFLDSLKDEPAPYNRLSKLEQLKRHQISSSGYVVDTLEAALWCLLHSHSYRDCVLLAVNLGEDTDTIAAIAGGLAGIIYGRGGELGIPGAWMFKLAKKDWLYRVCKRFEVRCQRAHEEATGTRLRGSIDLR